MSEAAAGLVVTLGMNAHATALMRRPAACRGACAAIGRPLRGGE